MLKSLIVCLLTSVSFSKRYIVILKEEVNVWMENTIVENKNMKKLNTKKTKMIFMDTEIEPEQWNDENVISYEEDKLMSIAQVGQDGHGQSPYSICSKTWGNDRINEENLPLDGIYLGDGTGELRGDDVDVYVLDTGINVEHTVFSTPPTWLANFGTIDTDCQGHGTHVAGTIGGTLTGVSPNANIFSVKISGGCTGSAYCSDMIDAIEYVQDRMENNGRKTVISLSFTICSSATIAINEFVSAGGLFSLAAGNDGRDKCTYSQYSLLDKSGAFLVGASGSNDDVSWFSNHGACVDIYAPGSAILSADYSDINNCVSWQGTSMATPHVSGAMAVLWARNPSMTNTQIRTLLMHNALTNKLDFGSLFGNNKLLYLDNDPSDSTPMPTPMPTPNDYGKDEKWYEIVLDKWWLIFPFIGVFFACVGMCIHYRKREIIIVRDQPRDIV